MPKMKKVGKEDPFKEKIQQNAGPEYKWRKGKGQKDGFIGGN